MMTVRKKMVSGAAVLVPALVLAACGDSSEDNPAPAPSSEQNSSAAQSSSGENLPGAMVGNNQRTWPDPSGMFDDSAHATPGAWSVDHFHQRPVWTPVNHDGDLPARDSLIEGGFDSCGNGEVALTGKTTQQYVNARYLVVNDQAGPSRLDNGVPAGFAHSPQGAILLALNAWSYGLAGQGDGVGEEIDREWWSTYRTLQEDRDFRGLNRPDYDHTDERAETLPGASYYHVKECSENVVVVEVGDDFTKAGEGTLATTIPVYWRDGDWVPDLSGQAGAVFDKAGTFDPASPAPLKEVKYQ
ncbi:hypothetical protein [Corynebacterium senegalense]|uniref:hypothetical protein n=1 Tax=Corynebacterium senegalense TaxID=2080750 RepID=UPI000E1FCBAF|nr:hypothetical protein [Corynebacterium senegalense]